jgi:hypothetical protein
MRTSTLLTLIIPVVLATSCATEVKPEPEPKKDTVIVQAPPPPPVNNLIRNGITLKSNILKVSQAFLVDENGAKLEDNNLINSNQYVTLRLIVDSGWIATNGNVRIGAAQKCVTSDGTVISDEKDLFADVTEVPVADAGILTLQVHVENPVKLYDYYQVDFKIWDKIGAGEASGTYRFNLK